MLPTINCVTMGSKYKLQWGKFPNHMVEVFKDLGDGKHFADVTLVSDDKIRTPAHKIVLSACSAVLKDLLIDIPHPNPLIYLRGIKQVELQEILNFMYYGETMIHKEGIDEFLAAAQDLEITELSKIGQEQSKAKIDLDKNEQEAFEEESVQHSHNSDLAIDDLKDMHEDIIHDETNALNLKEEMLSEETDDQRELYDNTDILGPEIDYDIEEHEEIEEHEHEQSSDAKDCEPTEEDEKPSKEDKKNIIEQPPQKIDFTSMEELMQVDKLDESREREVKNNEVEMQYVKDKNQEEREKIIEPKIPNSNPEDIMEDKFTPIPGKYQCDRCNLTFKSKAGKSWHKRNTHINETPSEEFPKLKIELKQRRHLNGTYECDDCDATFKYRSGRRTHRISIHGDNRSLKREKRFVRLPKVKTESRNPEGRYQCSECAASFKHRTGRGNHRISVHGENSLKCNKCDSKFNHRSLLTAHKQAEHHRGKLYECEECDAVYSTVTGLKQHLKSKHSNEQFSCDHCDDTFSRRSSVERHKQNTHRL